MPEDETGDCYLFTQRLMVLAQGLGVRFVPDTRIEAIRTDQGRITSIITDAASMTADAYVMALGSFSLGYRFFTFLKHGFAEIL